MAFVRDFSFSRAQKSNKETYSETYEKADESANTVK